MKAGRILLFACLFLWTGVSAWAMANPENRCSRVAAGAISNARYYDPILARFTQPDDVIQDIFNPQTYNRYSYCVNNPLRFTDPTGHGPDDDDLDNIPMTLGGAHAMLRQQAGGASAQLYNQSGGELRTVATVGRVVAEANPIVGTFNGAYEAKTGQDALDSDIKLTGRQRVLAGVGAAASIIPVGLEAKEGAAVLKAAKDVEKVKGSYVHEFESGAEYVGKGTKERMAQSGKQLEKANNDKLVRSTFEQSHPNTDKQAFVDEATKIENKGGIPNQNLYNKINSPGKKDLPSN